LNAAEPEAALIAVHDRFCRGFAEGRAELVLETVAQTRELVVVTSEEALLRGIEEVQGFLESYIAGPTTYSWSWDRRDVTIHQPLGCLLATGTETAAADGAIQRNPYRMTLVAEWSGDRWVLLHVHGSSPHHP
jgi:hypothetical protein